MGWDVGSTDGKKIDTALGDCDVGALEGSCVGVAAGGDAGSTDGSRDGVLLGNCDVGALEGSCVGVAAGGDVGLFVGSRVGSSVGRDVGVVEGRRDVEIGLIEGIL